MARIVRGTKYFNAVIFLVSVFASHAFATSGSGITYQGRILKPDGSPLAGAHTQFRMRIRTTGTENCVMYEELQEQDLSDSKGIFSLTLNDGNGIRQDVPTYDLEQVFANKGTFTFDSASCPTGDLTYAPAADDNRVLAVEFKDETMTSWEVMPTQNINYVPMALQAKNIAGFGIQNLVRVEEADGTLTNVTPLSNANYDALKLLVAGTSGLYEKPGKLGGISLPAMGVTAGKVLGWDGSAWTAADPLAGVQAFAKTALPACAAGAYIRNNAGALECTTPAIGGTGTVTEVRTGTGLTGGPITTNGDISLATLGAGGTGFKVTYDTYGRVTAAVALVEADIPTLSTAGKVVGSAITSGQITGSTSIDTSGLIKSTSGNFAALGTQGLQVFETTNSYKVSIVAPAALGANYTLTLPLDAGANGQVLTTNGSGTLAWATPAVGGSGDFKADGSVAMTGQFKAASGTYALPGISFAADPDTGFVPSGVDSITFASGGINRYVMDNAGIHSTYGGSFELKLGNAASGFASAANPIYGFLGSHAGLWTPTNDVLAVSTNSAERMRITSTGLVGIGTTLPGSMLDVKGDVRISGATSGYVGFAAPTAAGSTTYTWPSSPVAGNVLSTDASGNLSWAAASAGGMTALTGDVTAAGSGTQAATIANSAVTFAKMQNVPTTSIVGRYSAGAGAPESLTLGTGLALSAGGVLSATGTDTFAALPCADGYVPFKAASAWTCLEVAAANTISTLVRRDSAGAFVASSAKFTSSMILKDGVAGGEVTFATPTGFTSYALTLPTTAGTASQVLTTNGSGVLSWSTPAGGGGSGDFKADGSVPMTGNLQLNGKWLSGDGGNEGVYVDSAGKVGIGTTSLSKQFTVAGGDAVINAMTIGLGAGQNSTSTAVGQGALASTTATSYSNTAAGYYALNLSTDSTGYTAFGAYALQKAVGTVGYLSAFGYQALQNNTTGTGNSAVGYLALNANTTGSANTVLGARALIANVTGGSNTAVGAYSLGQNTGFQNNAFGADALTNNTTGQQNVGVGTAALRANTTGNSNVAMGHMAAASGTTARDNVALGAGAMWGNKTQSESTAVGSDAMYYANDTATAAVSYNTAVGASALKGGTTPSLNTGTQNTAFGHSALKGVTSGSGNIGIGRNSGMSITSGSFNVVIGSDAGGSIATSSNYILLNDGAGNRRMTIDNTGNVGIGIATPNAKLQVNGAVTNSVSTFSSAFTCASTSLDFSTSNFQRFSPSNTIGAGTCGVPLTGMAAGGSYTLVVTGNAATNAVTYGFSGYTFKYLPVNAATTAAKDTIYTFLYDGTTVYVTWSGGY